MKRLSSVERVRLARRRRDIDIRRTLYGYLAVVSLVYVCTISMHNGMTKAIHRCTVERSLVDNVANTKTEVVEGETIELPIVSIADSYVNPFGTSKFVKSNDDVAYETEDLSRASILETMYKPELVDDRIESLLDADGAIVVENKPFGKIDSTTGENYKLNDYEVVQLARLCTQEQGYNVDGVQAEASLILNRFENHNKKYKSLMSYVRNSGWWSKAGYYMDNGKTTDELVEAVREVVEGDRFFPTNVDEHDCLSDIISVSNNGVEFNKYDKSQYISGVTKIRNKYHSTYTFYTFPTEKSDPFGMIEV